MQARISSLKALTIIRQEDFKLAEIKNARSVATYAFILLSLTLELHV